MALSLRENMMLVMQHKEPEYLPLTSDFQLGFSSVANTDGHPTKENPVAKDWHGRTWLYSGDSIDGPCIDVNNPIMTDVTKWKERMVFPDLSQIDWEAAAARDTAHWDRKNKLVRMYLSQGMWESLYTSMNFVDALCALVEEPEACYEYFEAVANFNIEFHDYVARYYKPDIILMFDDYGSGDGLFMPPETWRKLIKPHLKRIVDHLHSHGIMYMHHCCGVLAPLIDDMIEIGVDSWHTVSKSNQPAELYQKVGKKIAMIDGFFDSQYYDFPNVTEEEIRASVRETIDAVCPGGAPAVLSPNSLQKHKERWGVVEDEMLNYAQQYYKSKRPV